MPCCTPYTKRTCEPRSRTPLSDSAAVAIVSRDAGLRSTGSQGGPTFRALRRCDTLAATCSQQVYTT